MPHTVLAKRFLGTKVRRQLPSAEAVVCILMPMWDNCTDDNSFTAGKADIADVLHMVESEQWVESCRSEASAVLRHSKRACIEQSLLTSYDFKPKVLATWMIHNVAAQVTACDVKLFAQSIELLTLGPSDYGPYESYHRRNYHCEVRLRVYRVPHLPRASDRA
jgi:hypothetical protein